MPFVIISIVYLIIHPYSDTQQAVCAKSMQYCIYMTGMHKKGPPNTQSASLDTADGGGGDGGVYVHGYICCTQFTPVSSEAVSESFS